MFILNFIVFSDGTIIKLLPINDYDYSIHNDYRLCICLINNVAWSDGTIIKLLPITII
jgi:hypothetical protein